MPDPTQAFIVKKMCEGFRRLRSRLDSRIPILYDTLVQICTSLPSICNSPYEAKLFKAAYAVAFFGLFRVSELVADPAQPERGLRREDVSLHQLTNQTTVKIRLRISKASQRSASIFVPLQPFLGPICPCTSLLQYLQLRPEPSDYFFCHINGKPLSRYQFGAILTKAITALDLPSKHYRTHSFRIGAATWLAKQGIPDATIQRMGRWSSQAFKKYIRL